MVQATLPAGIELITLQIRSANAWLAPSLPSLKHKLLGVVSHWPEFLEIARTMLAAAGVDPDLLVLRDTHRPRWARGLDQTAGIICDVLTAKTRSGFPAGPAAVRVFAAGRFRAVRTPAHRRKFAFLGTLRKLYKRPCFAARTGIRSFQQVRGLDMVTTANHPGEVMGQAANRGGGWPPKASGP